MKCWVFFCFIERRKHFSCDFAFTIFLRLKTPLSSLDLSADVDSIGRHFHSNNMGKETSSDVVKILAQSERVIQ